MFIRPLKSDYHEGDAFKTEEKIDRAVFKYISGISIKSSRIGAFVG